MDRFGDCDLSSWSMIVDWISLQTREVLRARAARATRDGAPMHFCRTPEPPVLQRKA